MSNHKHRRTEVAVTEPAPTPKATTFLNYKGPVTSNNIGMVMGPNTMGERLTVVEAVCDPDTDRTRVGLAYGIHEVQA